MKFKKSDFFFVSALATLQIHSREVLYSSPGQATCYPDFEFNGDFFVEK
jgi:hypothetical protein